MSSRHLTIVLSMLLCGASALSATFAADDDDQTFLDPAKAGPDYAIQGEYLGTIKGETGNEQWGAQVIALGDGKFDLVGYLGGLPGDGWSRGGRTEVLRGERTAENEAFFKNDKVELRIRGDELAVRAPGDDLGVLKKVSRASPTLGAKPSAGAIVLFDGATAEKFVRGAITEDCLLASDCETIQKFNDHSLHIEFRTPFKPRARGQARGNSGVYIQARYELQVLDSFGLEGKNNECGGIYSIAEPNLNMCFPPLTWQSYDIDYTAARYDDQGKKTKNARVTIRHNGVIIHNDLEIPHGTPGKSPEGPGPEGLYLQGHGNPVVYRNIWVVEKK